jgi:hypothetical protein
VVNNGGILAIEEGKNSLRNSTADPGSSVGPDTNNPADHA